MIMIKYQMYHHKIIIIISMFKRIIKNYKLNIIKMINTNINNQIYNQCNYLNFNNNNYNKINKVSYKAKYQEEAQRNYHQK